MSRLIFKRAGIREQTSWQNWQNYRQQLDKNGNEVAQQNRVNEESSNNPTIKDIRTLFDTFNVRFFQRKLDNVDIEWCMKMTQCTGICYRRYIDNKHKIVIRLSEQLLKSRSRCNLIETLLHEMIHAYLFIQNVNEENGGHGPRFKRIMNIINRVAGTNITVYHNFHDTVSTAGGEHKALSSTQSCDHENTNRNKTKVTESTRAWQKIDDDVLFEVLENTVIDLTDDDNNSHYFDGVSVSVKKHVRKILGDSVNIFDIIDDEFDDSLDENQDSQAELIAIDTCFRTVEFMNDFNNINSANRNDVEYFCRPDKEMIKCPICNNVMARAEWKTHAEDGCRGSNYPRVRRGCTCFL